MKPIHLLVPLALAMFALPAGAQQRNRAEACTDTIRGNTVMTHAQLRDAERQSAPEITDRAVHRVEMLQERLMVYIRERNTVPQRLFDFADTVPEVPWLSTCDPWGHRVVFTPQGKEYELRSAGPDGVLGTADDIVRGGLLEHMAPSAAPSGRR
ncbi:MAG TPA: hypothetical protein VF771_14720 [Longimicrobiaceae bacterium]